MKVPIELGQVNDEMTSGIVVGWLKDIGAVVLKGETLVEIELDKVVIEIPAPVAGRLVEIAHGADETVPFGTVLGFIDDDVT